VEKPWITNSRTALPHAQADVETCGKAGAASTGVNQAACCGLIKKMNQFAVFDSKLSLDGRTYIAHADVMIAQQFRLYIERNVPAQNMARFYALEITPTLFGDTCLTRRWGRIGTFGQTKQQHYKNPRDALIAFLELTRQKRRRGYQTRAAIR
jgi:predicted DNA-binding WGR domain protein